MFVIRKKRRIEIAACALALSLFLFPNFPARAESAEAYDLNADQSLDERDVQLLLGGAAGLNDGGARSLAVFRGRAGQAAALVRRIERDAALPVPESGLDQGATREAAEGYLRELLAIDLAPFKSRLRAYKNTYDGVAGAKDVYEELSGALSLAAESAAETCANRLRAELEGTGITVALRLPRRAYSWKETAALYRAYELDLSSMLAGVSAVSLEASAPNEYTVSVEFPIFEELVNAGEAAEAMTAKVCLAYLNTIYDAEGVFQEYEKYPLTESYLKMLIHPLEGDYLIKNGWYDARSRGTRRHTGTDITAPRNTPIHSVTDGVVLYIGYLDTPGNYVAVMDPYGFEYHYYHMVEQSKEVVVGQIVKQGDVIGLVGNTGNSVANHLHLAVISPEYTFINPYEMFLDAGIGPIRIDGEQP